jgi:DNA polymerase III subunit delta
MDNNTPISVIFGQNTYLRREATERVILRELGDGDPALNLSLVDGREVDVTTVLDDVRTFSLLGGRRVVVVDEADKFISANRKPLEQFAKNPADSGCLVLVCNAFDKRTKFYKSVQQMGESIACEPMKTAALSRWIGETAKKTHGKRMDRQAVISLMQHAGESQESLANELTKLALYVGDRPEILPDDVEQLVGRYREQNVFAVMDAIADGDVETALNEWQQVISTDRSAVGRAIGGLAYSVRKLLDARRKLDSGTSIDVVARLLWTSPQVAAKRMKSATVRQREKQLLDLLAADLDVKTGMSSFNGAVEKFIVNQSLQARTP